MCEPGSDSPNLLSVLQNIELNTAQQSSTPQNTDSIVPLSMQVNARVDVLTSGFSVGGLLDAVRAETFLFPIPAETPYLIIPETKRSLAFYRDSEQVPFAYVNAGQTGAFRLPHLENLRVDVLPSRDAATIIMYASSRPYEINSRLRPSPFFNAAPKTTVASGSSLISPIISTVDALAITWHIHFGAVGPGVTGLTINAIGLNDTNLKNGGTVGDSLEKIVDELISVPLNTTQHIITYPARYMYITATPQGADSVADLSINYSFVPV